jgi:glucose/arabinose dehydrogenase
MDGMRHALLWLFVLLLLPAAGCRESVGQPPIDSGLLLTEPFAGLTFQQPLAMVQAPGEAQRWYVAEKGGRVLTFVEGEATAELFADLRPEVDASRFESGLLGIAFHPDFQQNRQLFLSYTAPGGDTGPLISRISRFRVTEDGSFDGGTEEVILSLEQPFANHNGGQILFGPDGYLYIGFGDGGSGGDPLRHGQNRQTLFGAILRLAVDGEGRYAIPPDNPFVHESGAPEIYAYGLRNPWRFSFDRQTGRLWGADVGQDAWEEVNIITAGGNYGWNYREGSHCFLPPFNCPREGLIDPVAEYPNRHGDCSITGGYVYRGSQVPELAGHYLFGDFCSGRIWGLRLDEEGLPAEEPKLLLESALRISSFAEGHDGEVYVIDFAGGAIHRLASAGDE